MCLRGCGLLAGPECFKRPPLPCDPFDRAAHGKMDHVRGRMERTKGDNIVPLTHEHLATLLGLAAAIPSAVIQFLQGGGGFETPPRLDPGARTAGTAMRPFCQRIVKNHFEESAARGYIPRGTGDWPALAVLIPAKSA